MSSRGMPAFSRSCMARCACAKSSNIPTIVFTDLSPSWVVSDRPAGRPDESPQDDSGDRNAACLLYWGGVHALDGRLLAPQRHRLRLMDNGLPPADAQLLLQHNPLLYDQHLFEQRNDHHVALI